MEAFEVFDLEWLPDGRADTLIDAMVGFIIENAPIATCPNCAEMVSNSIIGFMNKYCQARTSVLIYTA